MEAERFVERILETENLTDELEDADAQCLLDWGLAELPPLLGSIQDAETAGEKANALMAVMRKINRLVGRMSARSQAELAEELGVLEYLFSNIHPGISLASEDELAQTAASLAELTPRAALELIFQRHARPQSPPPTQQE